MVSAVCGGVRVVSLYAPNGRELDSPWYEGKLRWCWLVLDDAALMRMYSWRLQQAGELDMAVRVLEQVLAQREDEPQSHRDLALAASFCG